jgi:hypothetical protein
MQINVFRRANCADNAQTGGNCAGEAEQGIKPNCNGQKALDASP